MENDAAYDKLRAKHDASTKAKNVLRGAGYARGGGVGARAKHPDEAEDKKLIKKEKSLEKDTKKVLAKDATRDKFVDAGKKAMKKGKC